PPGDLPTVRQPVERLDLPSEDERRAALDKLRQMFAKEYAELGTAELKASLGRQLFASAKQLGRAEPAELYVLLEEATNLTSAGGDLRSALDAIDELAARFN